VSELRVSVQIGELKVAGAGTVLFTVGLGSCVAIALYDASARIGGLAHAMLPDPSNGRKQTPPGRFASTAVPSLLEMMLAAGADPARVVARLAGGSSMFESLLDERGRRLGMRNVEAAREALARAGSPIHAEDVGGAHGRSVYLCTTDGSLRVTSVMLPDVIL
jgi:chemotaxis protein CheD